MNFFKTYFWDVVKSHYLDFGGKEGRKGFWFYVLIAFIIGFIVGLISSKLSFVVGLALLLPGLGILARRLRDAGFTPWLELLLLIPGIGGIILLILACFPSK